MNISAAVIRPPVRHAISSTTTGRNSTTLATKSLPLVVRVCQSNTTFPGVCRLSRYLLLNHRAEFNQTFYTTSLHGKGGPPHFKGMQEQHFLTVRPASDHLSAMLSSSISSQTTERNLIKFTTCNFLYG